MSPASHVAVRHGRRLVIAFVAGVAGTVTSDLLVSYDIFGSSPRFLPYVTAHAGPVPSRAARLSCRPTRSPTLTETRH